MKKDINDYITISRDKSGKAKITLDSNKEANIYKLLRGLGYGETKVDNKRIYFLREGTKIIPVNFRTIRDVFLNQFRNFEFTNIPKDIDNTLIPNWFYQKQPIKKNKLFNHYLTYILTDEEIHNYKLQNDLIYVHKLATQKLLTKFDEWSFSKTINTTEAFGKDNPLYYKKVGDKKYLVFNHYNSKDDTNDFFDCWLATFINEKHIGNKMPIEDHEIKLSFNLDTDFHLIEKYLN